MSADTNNVLADVVEELFGLLAPLLEAMDDPEELVRFLAGFGWAVPGLFEADLGAIGDAITELETLFTDLQETDIDELQGVLDTITSLNAAIQGLDALRDVITAHVPGSPPQALLGALAEDLVNALLLSYLARRSPFVYHVLEALTVISYERASPLAFAGALERLPFVRPVLRLDHLINLLQDPVAHLTATYLPESLDSEDVAAAFIERLGKQLGPIARLTGGTACFGLSEAPSTLPQEYSALRRSALLLFGRPELRLGTLMEVIPRGSSGQLGQAGPGVELAPMAWSEFELRFAPYLLSFAVEGSALRVFISQDKFFASAGDGGLAGHLRVTRGTASEPAFVLGSKRGTQLLLGTFAIGFKGEFGDNDGDFGVEVEISDGALVIATGDGDGFLSKVLPQDGIRAPFHFRFGWSKRQGVSFDGGAGLAFTLRVNRSLGPLFIETVDLGLFIDPERLSAYATVTVGLELGPLAAVVEGIGVKGDVVFGRKGLFGSADLDIGFLPPTGAGFGISGFVTGGGFLEFDTDNERYAGILALECMGVGITAIGLITTKMPDGSKGFSMLVNIGITFSPPIQISMGFTLSGVGGLLGINRTMVIDVLREGIRKGTLDSILFPDPAWVIPNAAKVISDLRAVFAPAEGRFIIGPMAQIGYGTPNFVIGELGVFLELPDPPRIVLLGQVSMSLPTPEAQIVGVNIDIVGVLDFQKKELSFQASINASSLMVFELFGGCAFFLRCGNQQEVAFAIGGFHPKFPVPAPPSIFGGMRRLGVNINYGPVIQLGVGGYLAVTPNSLQLGARVEVFIGIKALSLGIGGFISFDGLIYFSPFFFDVAIEGGMSVSVGSISLANLRVFFNLSGPTPWNVRGRAVIKILFIDIDVGFDVTWGRSDAATLPAIDPWPELERALLRAESWGSKLPAASSMVETLASLEESDETAEVGAEADEAPVKPVIVHPAGILEIRQNVAPLDLTLQKFANAPVVGHDHFRVTKVSTGPVDLSVESVDEYFARGQFQELSNAQKLSVPSFEKLPGGVATKPSGHLSIQGDVRSEPMGYESILIKPDRTSEQPESGSRVLADAKWAHMRFLSRGNASRRGTLRGQGLARFAHAGERLVGTLEERYVVATADTLLHRADIGEPRMTRGQAEQALERYLVEHPTEHGTLVVVSEFELDLEAA